MPETPTDPPDASGFFDWASTSPLCAAAAAARTQFNRRQDMAVDATLFTQEATADLDELRARLRRLVGAQRGWHVVLARSAAEVFSALAAGMPTRGRRTVVLAEPVHPAVTLAWLGAARRRALHVVAVPATPSGTVDLDAVSGRLADDCFAVCATHVSHVNGGVQPIRELAAAAAAVGAVSLVDGAQAVGRVPVDAAGTGCDIYVGVGRKALRAPIGTAFLAARPGLLDAVEPTVWSTRSARVDIDDRSGTLPASLPARLEGALPDLSALAALSGSVDVAIDGGVARLEEHVDAVADSARNDLAAAGLVELWPAEGKNCGIFTFAVDADTAALQADLRRQQLVVAADQGTVRVSIHRANAPADLIRLAEAVARHVRG